MIAIRPGQKVLTIPGPNFGVRVIQPMGGAPDWWDPNGDGLCIWGAWQAKGAASLAASYNDLSGNGNNVAPGVVPGWNAVQGWIFAGAQWLDTSFVPQNDQTQSILVQFANAIAATGIVVGMRNAGGSRFEIIPYFAGVPSVNYGNGAGANVVPPLQTGNLGIAGNRGYRNGVAEGAALGAWIGAPTFSVYIGARNNNGVVAFPITSDVYAVAIYDCTLTAPQVAAVAAAMAAL